VQVAKLGKRVYQDELSLVEKEDVRRLYRIYGDATHDPQERDTDLAAVSAGKIAITPLHFALTHVESLQALAEHDLERLLETPTGQP
jgi:5'-nucleotidase